MVHGAVCSAPAIAGARGCSYLVWGGCIWSADPAENRWGCPGVSFLSLVSFVRTPKALVRNGKTWCMGRSAVRPQSVCAGLVLPGVGRGPMERRPRRKSAGLSLGILRILVWVAGVGLPLSAPLSRTGSSTGWPGGEACTTTCVRACDGPDGDTATPPPVSTSTNAAWCWASSFSLSLSTLTPLTRARRQGPNPTNWSRSARGTRRSYVGSRGGWGW